MIRYLLLFYFFTLSSYAHTQFSGFIIPSELVKSPSWVYLSQVIRDTELGKPIVKMLAKSAVDEPAYFQMNTLLTEQQQLYFLQIANIPTTPSKYKITSPVFLLNNQDTVVVHQGAQSIKEYPNTNEADKEWQKFNSFREKLRLQNQSEKKFLSEIRSYSKDSLQILAVKLLSVKELNDKLLLDKDIVLNKHYYTDLLADLKQSDINPLEYLFLEIKLAEILVNETAVKYTLSFWLNIILGIGCVGLLAFILTYKTVRNTPQELSKQELIIKNLILKGNSNKEIAQELFISLSTVKSHITSIYQKLNLRGRADLTSKYKNTTGTSP